MLFNRSVRVLLSVLLCVSFSLVAHAHIETLHFYRSTEAGTWESLPDIDLDMPGNSGSLQLAEKATGPGVDKVDSILSGFHPMILKQPGRLEMCPSDETNFFSHFFGKKKKKHLTRRFSITKKAEAGREYIEVKIDDKVVAKYSMMEWASLARFDLVLKKMLGRNKAEGFSVQKRELTDEEVAKAKGLSISEAAAVAARNYEQEEYLEDTWGTLQTELLKFDKPNRIYVDFIFGTTCLWNVTVYSHNGKFAGFLFSHNDQSFLVLLSSVLQNEQLRRRRSSPVVIAKGRRRGTSTSSEQSDSELSRSGGSSRWTGSVSPRGLPSPDSSYFQSRIAFLVGWRLEWLEWQQHHQQEFDKVRSLGN